MTAAPMMTMTSPVLDPEWPGLTGRQVPHHLSVSVGDTALGDKAIELARRLRTRPMPWQADCIRAIQSRTPEGRWTHTDCTIICPRQNGKSLVLSIIVVYRLFVLGETIIFTAQQWRTAESLWKRTFAMVKSRPSLMKHVQRYTCSQGRGTIELSNGAAVTFTTRSADAGRGLDDVDTLIYDEAYNLTDGEIAALGFTQSAAKNPQTIFVSSAVNQDQHQYGAELAALRERGLAGDEPDYYFAEFMAPVEMDRNDPVTWAYANPSYGVIHTEEKVRKMMRSMSTPEGRKAFDVEALGRGDWPVEVLEDEVRPVVDLGVWGKLVDMTPRPTGLTCLAVDMSTEVDRQDRTCSVLAAAQTAGGAHLQVGYHGPASTSKVVKFLVAAVDAGDPVAVVIDPKSAAQVLIEPLRAAGVEPELMTFAGVQEATAGFLAAVDEGRVSHDGDQRMADALDVAKLREVGDAGGIAWTRKKSGLICQLVAASNALWGLGKFAPVLKPPPGALAYVPGDGGVSLTGDLMEVSW